MTVSVSATTRPRRSGEREGRDYFFLSEEDFRRRIYEGAFLEWATYSGHLYGTPKAALCRELGAGRDVIVEIELAGARQVLEECPEALMIFITPPSLEELERRLRGRNTEGERAIRLRLERAEEEMAAVQGGVWPGLRQFDYVIVNDSVKRASDELARIIERTREEHEQADSR